MAATQERILVTPYTYGESTPYFIAFADDAGNLLVTIQFFCFFLLFFDVLSRFAFKTRLDFFAAYRTIFIIFALCVPWFIGYDRLYANSGFLHHILGTWFAYVYNWPYKAKHIDLFRAIKDGNGDRPYAPYFHYVNALLIPLIIFYILYITKCVIKKQIEDGEPWANFIAGLEWIWAFSFGFPFVGWAILWIKQLFEIIKWNRHHSPNLNVWTFNYIFGWLVALPTLGIIVWDGIIGIYFVAAEYMSGGGSGSGNANGGTAVRTGGTGSRGNDLGITGIAVDHAFTHMNKSKAVKNPFAAYYNSALLSRWAFFAVISLIFDDFPRTMYCILWILDICFLAYSCMAMPGFFFPCAIPVIIEEIAVLMWHFFHWLIWIDVEGRVGYSQGWVKFYTTSIFILILAIIACEILLLFFGLAGPRFEKEGNDNFEDNAFSELSNNELNNKIQTYNTMRSGVKQQSSNRN